MKTWQVLVLVGLFVLVILVLFAALNLAMPFIAGPPTPTPTPKPTSTPTVWPTSAPPTATSTPTSMPSATATRVLATRTPVSPSSLADDGAIAGVLEATLASMGYDAQCMIYYTRGDKILSALTALPSPDVDTTSLFVTAVSEFVYRIISQGGVLDRVVVVIEDTIGEEHLGIVFTADDAWALHSDQISADEFIATWRSPTDADLP